MRLLPVALLAAAFAFTSAPAHADQDAVHFFSDIHVTPDAPVSDAVCFFCNVRVDGKVTGDIVVFFGGVHLSGDAQHDVVNIFGSVRADNNASIEDDLVSIFGNVSLGENVTVGKDVVSIFGLFRAPASVSIGGDRTVMQGWILFVPLLIVLILIVAIVSKYRAYRRRLATSGYYHARGQ